MKAEIFLATAIVAIGTSGCAHHAMRGSVAMKTSDSEAHVCLGKGEVKAGDRLTLYKNVCTTKGGGGRGEGGNNGGSCQIKELGMGSVQTILNDHYSVVKFDQGVQFEEGTFVEMK